MHPCLLAAGTHVAGTIAAKNNGFGVYGVVPGMALIAHKVFNASASAVMDHIWSALDDILFRLQQGQKIVAVNLSFGLYTPEVLTIVTMCEKIRRIAEYGCAVVAAAGNDQLDVNYFVPAGCPDATVVTSITKFSKASTDFSNWAPSDAPAITKDRMIAAPGSDIYSTLPGGKYIYNSGTSMAAPMVTGGYAKCFLSNFCKLSSTPTYPAATTNIPIMQAAARAASCLACPQFGTDKYYGYVLNVRKW
jgi:subtilisin family serine protease